MKRLMFVLMCVCLMSLAQAAFQLTNGDFEVNAGPSIDNVDEWYDDIDAAGFWNSAWQSNDSWITPNGTQVVVFCSWNTVENEPLTGSYIYQDIGTSTGETSMTVQFDWGHPDDVGANRHDGITIAVYASDGTTIPGDNVDIEGAAGVTLLDYAQYDHIAEGTDGEIWTEEVTLDTSGANAGDVIFLRFNNYLPEAGADPWPVLDNVEILYTSGGALSYDSPPNRETGVAIEVGSTENDLTWTINDPNITKFDLYFGPENDPNLTLDPEAVGYKVIDLADATTGQDSWSPPYVLEYLTDYYWKVIGYEPNELGEDLVPIPGPVWTFRTINDMPTVSAVDPVVLSVPAGDDADLTVTGELVIDYHWYKVGVVDELVDDDVNYSIARITDDDGDRSVLTVLDVQESAGDEGYFYCVGSNTAGEDTSEEGRVMEQRLTSYWPLDSDQAAVVDGNDVQLDTEDGYTMVLLSDDDGPDKPSLDPNVVSPIVGDESLRFKNDNPSDPNNGFAQIARIEPGVAEFGDITISCWYYWEGGGNWEWMLGFTNSATSENYMFLTPNSGNDTIRFAIGSVGNEDTIDADMVPGGRWTWLTVTLEGDTARIYVNGELESTNEEFTNNPYIVDMAANYVATSIYPDPYFNGLIDDLKIYNYARSTYQIAQDYLDVQGDYICDNEVEALVYDFNDDCRTNLEDFAMFATEWLGSNRIYPE